MFAQDLYHSQLGNISVSMLRSRARARVRLRLRARSWNSIDFKKSQSDLPRRTFLSKEGGSDTANLQYSIFNIQLAPALPGWVGMRKTASNQ